MESTLVGYDVADLGYALDVMEKEVAPGQWAQIQLCTDQTPPRQLLDQFYLSILATGHNITEPTFSVIDGIPTTTFNIQREMPYEQYQWALLVPLFVPLLIGGIVVFGITRLGISPAP